MGRRRRPEVPDWQVQKMFALINDGVTQEDALVEAGIDIPLSTLRRQLQLKGVTIPNTLKPLLTAEQSKYLEEHYATTPTVILAEMFGVNFYTLVCHAKKRGMKKDEKTIAKYRYARSSEVNTRRWREMTPEVRKSVGKAISEGIKRTVRAERRRILYGLPQKTKLKVISKPKEKVTQTYYLRKLGYIMSETEKNVFYAPPEVDRGKHRRLEQSAYEKFKIRIKDLDNETTRI